jgi:hypothetical protein
MFGTIGSLNVSVVLLYEAVRQRLIPAHKTVKEIENKKGIKTSVLIPFR